MRRILFLAVVVELVCRAGFGQTAPADAAGYIGKPVVEVGLLSEGRPVEDPAAAALIETRVGEPLSMAEVRESITHLFGLGRFQDVRVDATDAPGGVRLHYDLIPLHSVQEVNFRAVSADQSPASGSKALGVDEGLLRRTMTNRFGASPPVGRAPEVARTLEQVYHDEGFLRATVRPVALEKHDPDRTLLTFEIDPGPRAAIGAVQVEGTPIGTRDAFLKTIGVAPGAPYQPAAITAALSTYVQKLHKRGRYEAAASYRPRPSADATVVDLTVFVQIGRAVTIAYRGDSIPREKLADLVPLAREASVDEDLVEDSVQRIKRYLNQQGYWKADTTVEREEGDGTLTIVFTVHKGAHYVVSQGVEIEGNRSVPIEQLRPALVKLQPNDVFVESNLSAAVSAIAGVYQKLGYAQAKVNASANELNPPAPGQGLVRPVIVITEGPLTLVGEVTFQGDASIPEDQLRPLITSVPGISVLRTADRR